MTGKITPVRKRRTIKAKVSSLKDPSGYNLNIASYKSDLCVRIGEGRIKPRRFHQNHFRKVNYMKTVLTMSLVMR